MLTKHKMLIAGTALGAVAAFVSTQTIGTMLGFDPRLGGFQFPLPKPFTRGAIYHPFLIYAWATSADSWPGFFVSGLVATTFSIVASIGAAGTLIRDMIRGGFRKKKFGEGAWGTREDAVAAGLIAGEGPAKGHAHSPFTIVLGEAFGTTLTITDDRFYGIFMGTRDGKSRMLSRLFFTWKSSIFAYLAGATTDIWELTSGYRATFSDVIFLDLGNPDGYRYNPLSEIRKGTDFEWDDCKMISNCLPIQSARTAKVPYWVTSPTKIIAAIIRYVIHCSPPRERTFATVRDMAALPLPALAKLLRSSPHKNVRDKGDQIANSDPNKMQELMNSVLDYLSPWDSEILRKVTSESDFSMMDLMAGRSENPEKPVTLYVRVPDDIGEEWDTIVKVLFAQARRALLFSETKMPDGREKIHELAFVMDEFASVMDDRVPSDIAKMAKYGGRVVLATQSSKSLQGNFGSNQTIMANLKVVAWGSSNDADTQKEISDSVGMTTEVRQSKSSASEFLSPLPKSRGVVHSEQVRKLLDSGEVRMLPRDEMLVLATGAKPFRVKKTLNFTDLEPWKSMIKPPAPTVPAKPRNPESVAGAFV